MRGRPGLVDDDRRAGLAPQSRGDFHVLGTLGVVVDGAEVPMVTRRQRALLVLLLMSVRKVVPVGTADRPAVGWRTAAAGVGHAGVLRVDICARPSGLGAGRRPARHPRVRLRPRRVWGGRERRAVQRSRSTGPRAPSARPAGRGAGLVQGSDRGDVHVREGRLDEARTALLRARQNRRSYGGLVVDALDARLRILPATGTQSPSAASASRRP